jgi:hypothetical protein
LLGEALDATALGAVGVLELDLLLSATLVEVLARVSLVLLVKCLDSASGFGTSDEIFLVE